MCIRENYEFENSVIEKVTKNIEASIIWNKQGTQEILINVLRDTIQQTRTDDHNRIVEKIMRNYFDESRETDFSIDGILSLLQDTNPKE